MCVFLLQEVILLNTSYLQKLFNACASECIFKK